MTSMLRHLSIKTRVLLVSAVLIAILAGMTFYTTAKLAANSRAVAETAELAALSQLANQTRTAFGEYRYWLTDLAVSLLRLSELNAKAAKERLLAKLDELARGRPEVAKTIKQELQQFESDATRAVEEYTADQRVIGNTFLASARQHSIAIDARITSFVEDLNREAAEARNRLQADVARTRLIAAIAVALAVLLGLAATLIVLRSISKPLDDVVAAMAGISGGDLDAPIPAPAPDEIGAMARTLELFRSSIIERTKLSAHRDEQRRMIQTAIETISDGFALFDPDDRLVLCNSRFRELYPKLDDMAQPGTPFSAILKAGVERGVLETGGQAPDAWISERLRRHSKPEGLVEYHHGTMWVRSQRATNSRRKHGRCLHRRFRAQATPAGARGSNATGRDRKSRQIGLLGQHEPRAADAPQCHYRTNRDDGEQCGAFRHGQSAGTTASRASRRQASP